MFAESCVFGKQSQPPITCDLYELLEQVQSPKEAYLLPKLRYQFAEFLNPSSLKRLRRLSPHPPVSVYGTVNDHLKLRGFSRKRGINHFGFQRNLRTRISGIAYLRIFQEIPPTTLNGTAAADLAFSVTPSQWPSVQEC